MKKQFFIALLIVVCFQLVHLQAQSQSSISERISENGLLKTSQVSGDVFEVDSRAEGVQYKREADWGIFFEEANRAVARLAASSEDAVEADTYPYLVAFYRALTDEAFRDAFLEANPSIEPFGAQEALETALENAMQGLVRVSDKSAQLDILIEWYETLSQARNLAVEGTIDASVVDLEMNNFTAAVGNVAYDLTENVPAGQAVEAGKHLRALGLNFGLSNTTRSEQDAMKAAAFNKELYQTQVDYAVQISDRTDISFEDKMEIFADAAVAQLRIRDLPSELIDVDQEQLLTGIADSLWNQENVDSLDELTQLEKKIRYVFLKDNIGAALWLGKELKGIPEQEEPKPYKLALEKYRDIYEQAKSLLDSGSLDADQTVRAELVALEAQSWVSQLIQDKGIVFSSDFTFEDAEVEKEKLLAIRQQVEANPNQTSQDAWDLINKARLHEIEFYQYQYTEESLAKSIELIDTYAPQVIPSMDEVIPAPEGSFAINCGVGMLVWKAEAFDRLKRLDEAEELFTQVVELYGDRYRYPDPWCFSFVGFSEQHLHNIPAKKADLANANQNEGGIE